MSRISRCLVWLLVVSVSLGPFGCASTHRAKVGKIPATKEEFLQTEIAKAEQISASKNQKTWSDESDEWLRVASMALDAGKPEYARQVLGNVTTTMSGILTDKEFQRREGKALRPVGGWEHEKYFLGDPYEQLLAYLYLGMLDFQAGDYELARVSFRNATLADQESAKEGYKSDCYLAFLLEGFASKQLGEQENEEDAFRFAQRAFAFRQNMAVVQAAMYGAVARLQPAEPDKKFLARLDRAFPLVFQQLPSCLTVTEDPTQAIEATFAAAKGALDKPAKESPAKKLLDACSKKDQALELLDAFRKCVLEALTPESIARAKTAQDGFASLVNACRDPNANTIIIQQIGQAPVKIRSGRYGNVVAFQAQPCPVDRVISTIERVDNSEKPLLAVVPMTGERVDYQARTRGGREMDSVLEGRAQFRDAMNITSGISLGVASAALYAASAAAATMVTTTVTTVTYTVSTTGAVTASTTTTTTAAPAGMAAATPLLVAAGVAIVLYKLTKMIGDAAHPEGDIRGWHELPGQLMFTCAKLEPGKYELSSQSFDKLARPVPDVSRAVRFTVEPGKTSLVLCGSPWR